MVRFNEIGITLIFIGTSRVTWLCVLNSPLVSIVIQKVSAIPVRTFWYFLHEYRGMISPILLVSKRSQYQNFCLLISFSLSFNLVSPLPLAFSFLLCLTNRCYSSMSIPYLSLIPLVSLLPHAYEFQNINW